MTRKSLYYLAGAAILIAGAVTAATAQISINVEREKGMIQELNQLRSAVQIYIVSNKQRPADLAAALLARYPFRMAQSTVKMDTNGQPVDPFGNRYIYNGQTGFVNSTSSGYENW